MKKKTYKKHYSQLYKGSCIVQTVCNSDEWPAPIDSYSFVTIKRCRKRFTKKSILRLISNRKAFDQFRIDQNVETVITVDQIIDSIKHNNLYKGCNRFGILILDDAFFIKSLK